MQLPHSLCATFATDLPYALPIRIYRYIFLRHTKMNRIPVILTIDQIEYLLDQIPPPDKDEDELVTKLREQLKTSLEAVREGAE